MEKIKVEYNSRNLKNKKFNVKRMIKSKTKFETVFR